MQPECDPFFLRFNPEISVPLIAGAAPLAGLRAAVRITKELRPPKQSTRSLARSLRDNPPSVICHHPCS